MKTCEKHDLRYAHYCWKCEYELTEMRREIDWGERMTEALIVNQRAHAALMDAMRT